MGTSLTLQQTLHGYAEGHELLASSIPLALGEKRLLDRLSDLSGYLPSGFRFDAYFTGFPCERFYALACTWPDLKGTRAGTVLTHTLLIPMEMLAQLESLLSLRACFQTPQTLEGPTPPPMPGRRPIVPRDLLPYRKPLEIVLPQAAASVGVGPVQRGLRTLFLTREDRPLLWLCSDAQAALAEVDGLWQFMWLEHRRQWSFCTLALQPRTLHERPFELLALPGPAKGAFLEFSRTRGWLQGEQLDALTQAMAAQPHVQMLLEPGGRERFQQLGREARAAQLPLPGAPGIPKLQRLLSLMPEQEQRLSAAKAVLDLLELLYPELEPTHRVRLRAFKALLEQQDQCPVSPRPMWELLALLKRPLTSALLEVQAPSEIVPFGALLDHVLEQELLRRFRLNPSGCFEALPALEEALKPLKRAAQVDQALEQAVGSVDAENRPVLVAGVLTRAFGRRLQGLLYAVLNATSPDQRWEMLQPPLDGSLHVGGLEPAAGQDLEWLLEVVRRLPDVFLLLRLHQHVGQEARGLEEALALALEVHPEGPQPEALLDRVRFEVAWAWCGSQQAPPTFAMRWAERRLPEQGWSNDRLWDELHPHPTWRGLLYRLLARSPSHALREWLKRSPARARLFLLHALGSGASYEAVGLGRDALEVLGVHELLTPELQAALGQPGLTRDAEQLSSRVLEKVGQEVVLRTSHLGRRPDKTALDLLSAWWLLPSFLKWMASQSEYAVKRFFPLEKPRPDALPPLLHALNRVLEQRPEAWGTWMSVLLRLALVSVDGETLREAIRPLEAFLERTRGQVAPKLASEVVAAVRRTRCWEARSLLVVAFPRFYPDLHAGRWQFYDVSWANESGWDKAKPWRHWLLDTWEAQRWPASELLHILTCHRELARKVLKRAFKSGHHRLLTEMRHHLDHHWTGDRAAGRDLLDCLKALS